MGMSICLAQEIHHAADIFKETVLVRARTWDPHNLLSDWSPSTGGNFQAGRLLAYNTQLATQVFLLDEVRETSVAALTSALYSDRPREVRNAGIEEVSVVADVTAAVASNVGLHSACPAKLASKVPNETESMIRKE